MSKALEAFRTISEVAGDLDIPKHVLRFWEVKFPQIKPMKRGGGRRYYRPEDLVLLRGIQHLLHAEGYTIKGVQKILREQGIEQVKFHGLAATELVAAAQSGNAKAAKSTASTVAGRVRALPKSLTLSGHSKQNAAPAAHFAAIAAAIGELKTCRDILRAADSPARSASPASEHRRAKSARSSR